MSFAVAALLVLAPQAAAEPPSAPVKKEKKLCRNEATSFSRMGKQTCHTRTEWAEIDKSSRAARDEAIGDGPRLNSPR